MMVSNYPFKFKFSTNPNKDYKYNSINTVWQTWMLCNIVTRFSKLSEEVFNKGEKKSFDRRPIQSL